MALTDKQRRFVDEYLVDLNATQAAIRAGYSKATASRIGPELLGKTCVAEAIAEARHARSERTQVTADRVLKELAAMALYDPAELVQTAINSPADIAKLPEQVRRAIIGWSWDRNGNFVLKLSPKTPSLELIGRHLSLFKDNLNVIGSISIEDLRAAAQTLDAELARLASAGDEAKLH